MLSPIRKSPINIPFYDAHVGPSAAWQKQRARPKALTSAEIYASPAPATHSSLACPICERLTKNAVRTPCCRSTFCEECIQTHLLEHDFVCQCGKKIPSFDRLEVEEKRREQVGEAVRSMIEESRKESVSRKFVDVSKYSKSSVLGKTRNRREHDYYHHHQPPHRDKLCQCYPVWPFCYHL